MMAEAVAAVSLVASILQLVDFGSKLVGRMNDFVADTKDVPATFQNITVQLPLAIATLQRLRIRIEKSEILGADLEALKAAVESSVDLTKRIHVILSKVVPSMTSSSVEKRLLAIRSLRYDKKVQNLSQQLLQNVTYLVFFQTTHIQDNEIDLQRFPGTTIATPSCATNFDHGLILGGAPLLADGNFIGRNTELKQLTVLLNPESQRQSVVAVVGMGGIGKTQLCVEYSLSHEKNYSSIFWLNAQNEASLRADFLTIANTILPDQTNLLATRAEEKAQVQKIRRWFSYPGNQKWLLIFDNLDNPRVPGDDDPASLDVRDYFPYRSQGSILLTTRSRKISFAKQLHLEKLGSIKQGLEVLANRSGRDFAEDHDVLGLVKRLDGLPLALTTAASYLNRTSCTSREYLDEYEKNWQEEIADSLFEYGERTLYTTWNLSLVKLKSQSPETAELLRVLAFFGNENVDYPLLAGRNSRQWPGLENSLRTKVTFDRAMAILRDYSLVEASDRSYRLHPCLHDWTLSKLNRHLKERDVWLALSCVVFVAESSSSIWSTTHDESLSKVATHAVRLIHVRLLDILMNSKLEQSSAVLLCGFGQLLNRISRNREAVQLLQRSLDWSSEHLGPDHQNFLVTSGVLGVAYQRLQNFTDAEALMKQAVSGLERTLGRHNRRTLDSVHNLALLYMQLDRLEEAEEMYFWSLRGCEESYGPQDPNTFWAAMALADLYLAKNDLENAEKEFRHALEGFDAAINPDHFFSRFTATRLGAIYKQQGMYPAAFALYQRVFESCIRLFGLHHWMTQEAQTDLHDIMNLTNGTTERLPLHTAAATSNVKSYVYDPQLTNVSTSPVDHIALLLDSGTPINSVLRKDVVSSNEGEFSNSFQLRSESGLEIPNEDLQRYVSHPPGDAGLPDWLRPGCLDAATISRWKGTPVVKLLKIGIRDIPSTESAARSYPDEMEVVD